MNRDSGVEHYEALHASGAIDPPSVGIPREEHVRPEEVTLAFQDAVAIAKALVFYVRGFDAAAPRTDPENWGPTEGLLKDAGARAGAALGLLPKAVLNGAVPD